MTVRKSPSTWYVLFYFSIILCGCTLLFPALSLGNQHYSKKIRVKFEQHIRNLYQSIGLQQHGLEYKVFRYALIGFYNLQDKGILKRSNPLTIVDFRKSSNVRRLYVLDLKEEKLLFRTLVAHGKASGNIYAQSFSNLPRSHKSSLGFYVTANTYYGNHGYSLRLRGVEEGINDKAFERAIVMHGAEYVCQSFAQKYGRIGRSFGCPALPKKINRKIIDTVKDGSCLFLYHPKNNYTLKSDYLDLSSAIKEFAQKHKLFS